MRISTLLLALLLLALPGAMAATSWLVPVPEVRAANSPSEFDAVRARDRLARILGDERPHPADSPGSDGVRARLLAEMRGVGLDPRVRDQIACNEGYKSRGVTCARVRNIVATIGPPGGRRLLLNAHYDSSVAGPGAGDDGVGVATLLEVAAILGSEPLRRPVTFLFNEGEELGLIGARAFLADPLSRDVDRLINLEARGTTGPVNMFETSVPNGAAVEAFAQAVDRPVANSLATDVYRQMPNYTDVNSFAERGWLTLNFAMIGNETRYHSPGDNLAALDPRSLQHMGDQALAVARQLAHPLPAATDNQVFMDFFGRWLVHLPQAVGLILLAASLVGLSWLAWRRRALGRGVAVIGAGLLLGTALAWVGTAAVGLARPGMFWRAYPDWTHLAVYASALLAGVAVLRLPGRQLDVPQLRAAFWLAFAALGAIVALAAPLGIVFFLFPPLLFALGVIAGRWHPRAEQAGAWLAALLLYFTLGAMVGQLEELLNQGPMWLFAPLGLLVMMPVLVEARPWIAATPAREAIGIASVFALLGWAAAAAAPAYSADRQQQFTIEHVTDIATRRSSWSVLDDFAALPDGFRAAGQWRRGKLPYSDRKRWLANAPPLPGLEPPAVEVVGRSVAGGARRVRVRLHPNGAETVALVARKDARVLAAGTGAFVRPISRQAKESRYVVRCFGRSCDGLAIDIAIGKAAPVEFIVLGSRAGLPPAAASLLAARRRYARPQYSPDATITMDRLRL
jgi:hypothetical protein